MSRDESGLWHSAPELPHWHLIGVGSREWGPESGEFGLGEELFLLGEILALKAIDTGCVARPYFFFEIEGRFAGRKFETRLRRCVVYKTGHASAQFEVALETVRLPSYERRKQISSLLKDGSLALAKRVGSKWPDFRAQDYLDHVESSCNKYLNFPSPYDQQ